LTACRGSLAPEAVVTPSAGFDLADWESPKNTTAAAFGGQLLVAGRGALHPASLKWAAQH